MPKVISIVPKPAQLAQKKRVAAYARVSSGKDAMLHSLSSQVSYYSKMIQEHTGWLYAGVYADEAKTGTKDSREDFQRLLADCRTGKIDMVITKSISRFARNTVTLLETVRELKSIGVDVFFEEQNIHTLSSDGELMLTILASYAQEESRSASENQKWRIRKSFEKGELINWRFMFGYRISKGKVEVDESTSPIVREIFQRVIDRESFGRICRDLNHRGIKHALGGKWCVQRIRDMVSNEKYTGNALLQKTYLNNHIDKKQCRNTGQLPMFYAEETHPAIIDQATFEAAQIVLKEISAITQTRPLPQQSEFTGRIRCPHCGKNYKRIKSNGSFGWNCQTYHALGKAHCFGKKIPETTLKAVCAQALGSSAYDATEFLSRIAFIEVPDVNQLLLFFKDGESTLCSWTDRSRRESWTKEMRQSASEREMQRRHQHV